MRALLARLASLWRRRRLDRELADELSAHLEFAEADYVAGGMSTSEAKRAAETRFGGSAQITEAVREQRGLPLLESIWKDAAFGLRHLRRQPSFTATGLIVLATVIGANTSLFTFTAGLMLRPWSGISDPARVVVAYPIDSRGRTGGFSVAGYRSLASQAHSISLALIRPEIIDVGAPESSRKTGAFLVSGNFFRLLGVPMAHGRAFGPDDDRLDRPSPVAIMGFDLWQTRFGADPSVVGATVALDGAPFTIVGIAARDFVGPEPGSARVFVPIASVSLLRPNDPEVPRLLYAADECCADIVGRLAPGATRNSARAELDLLNRRFAEESGLISRAADADTWRIQVAGTAFLDRPGRKNQILAFMSISSAALLLVWLLACANLGNLHIARAASRSREIAIRLALGAGRHRVVRQLIVEGFILALAAGVLGVLAAYAIPPVVVKLIAGTDATPFSLAPDATVMLYALALAAASTMVFGLAPALHATRAEVANVLKGHNGEGPWDFRLRNVLLAVQVAISVVLLVAAGLLVRGARQRTAGFDPGFDARTVSVISLDVPMAYDEARSATLLRTLGDALRSEYDGSFGFVSRDPLALSRQQAEIRLPAPAGASPLTVRVLDATAGYFDVLRIPLVAGRSFRSADTSGSIIVNEALVNQYWARDNPVGKIVLMDGAAGFEAKEIVGVVRNAYLTGLESVQPTVFRPLASSRQFPKLLIRGAPTASAHVARLVNTIDPRVAVQATSLSASLDAALASSRYGAAIAAALGLCALGLATVGTYGVFAYAVRRRTREIAVRIALGATSPAVVRLLLVGQSRALLFGLCAGVLLAIPASLALRAQLYGLSPFDPLTYAGVAVTLGIAAVVASYQPVRRAARVDPMTALRDE